MKTLLVGCLAAIALGGGARNGSVQEPLEISLSPTRGNVGDKIVVQGEGLAEKATAVFVYVGGLPPPLPPSFAEIIRGEFEVPARAGCGLFDIHVVQQGVRMEGDPPRPGRYPQRSNTVRFEILCPPEPPCDSNCYTQSDCPSGYFCNHTANCINGKFDGFCQAFASMVSGRRLPVSALAEVVTGWFDAYLEAGSSSGKGRVPGETVSRLDVKVQALSPQNQALLPTSNGIKLAVHLALDSVLGWDIRLDSRCQKSTTVLAGILPLNREASEFVKTIRDGFRQAILADDAKRIVPALDKYWQQYPTFRPMHTGRCYAHGHDEIKNLDDTRRCQADTLTRILVGILGVRNTQQ